MIEWLAGGAAGAAALGLSARYNWWRRPLSGVPVLMYHLVTDEMNGTSLPKLRVSPRRFAEQLDHLKSAGWRAVTLTQAMSGRAPKRSVVISFDDGYENFYMEAWPLLQRRGMTATVFVVSGGLDGQNTWDQGKDEPLEPLLTRRQAQALAAAGVEIGGHSHSHTDLTKLDDRALMREVTGCQKVLTDMLGRPVRSFSYPYGLHNERVRHAVLRAGFTTACTTRPGKIRPGFDPLMVPRIIVKRSDSALDFRLKLSRARSRL